MLVISDGHKSEEYYDEDIINLNVPVGRLTYGFNRFRIALLRGIRSIGRFCSIVADVSIAGVHHPLEWGSTHPFLYHENRGVISHRQDLPDSVRRRNELIEIQYGVWIGDKARILRPCVLGHGSVVASGSLVNRHVPPYAIVAGVPARIIIINRMLSIAWWSWDLDLIRNNSRYFYDPRDFVERFSIE